MWTFVILIVQQHICFTYILQKEYRECSGVNSAVWLLTFSQLINYESGNLKLFAGMATPVNPKKSTDIAVIEKPHSVLIFHSEDPAKHPSPPARAAQADFSQSPDKGAASADWSAQSPPPACCRDRIHPQCAPTPPKSAAVRLHQKSLNEPAPASSLWSPDFSGWPSTGPPLVGGPVASLI